MAFKLNFPYSFAELPHDARRRFFVAFTTAVGLSSFCCGEAAKAVGPTGMIYEGVNIAGAEFTPHAVPGTFLIDYVFPTDSEIDYFSAKGMECIRVPILWERLQPAANGELDAGYVARLDSSISKMTAKGMSVIVDVHNYGAYRNTTVGVPGGHPNSMFADLWSRLATRYKGNPKVIFGLMNEPVGSSMTATTWLASSQAAINAVRATGATNLILVPSTYWMHPKDFVNLNASVMINITDPFK